MKFKFFTKKVKNFIFNVDNKSKLTIIKAFIYSGIARIYIFYIPFNKLKKKMGVIKLESDEVVDIEVERIAKGIAHTVRLVSNRTPWESKCLVQALTAQWLLKDKGVETTLYLGVKKDNRNDLLAHAWTRCGEFYVTGGNSKDGYVVVAKFTSIVSKKSKEKLIQRRKLSRQ